MPENIRSLLRPLLPWDVLLLIFDASDQDSLSRLGRASYDFLVSTSPLLYGRSEVRIESLRQLEQLFCDRPRRRKDHPPSRIDSLLGLSQIRNLVCDLRSPPQGCVPLLLDLHSSRSINSSHLQLDSLHISCQSNPSNTLGILYIFLLPLLNPLECTFSVPYRHRARSPYFDLGSIPPILFNWTRLVSVTFSGCLPFGSPYSSSPSIPQLPLLAYLPSPTLERRRILRLRLSTLLSWAQPDVGSFLTGMQETSRIFNFGTMQEGSIVLVVDSEADRQEVEGALLELKTSARRLFAVEVEEIKSEASQLYHSNQDPRLPQTFQAFNSIMPPPPIVPNRPYPSVLSFLPR